MSQTRAELHISPTAKRAAEVLDKELTKFLAQYGIKKRTSGKFLVVAEKLIQMAINEAIRDALTEIANEAHKEVFGFEQTNKTEDQPN